MHLRGMSITAIVENDTIKLPMHVPDGTSVEITLPEEGSGPVRREPLAALAGLTEPMGALSNDEIDRAIYGR
jgi:hypothetical protein